MRVDSTGPGWAALHHLGRTTVDDCLCRRRRAEVAARAAAVQKNAAAMLLRRRLRRQLRAWAALPVAAAGQRHRRALAHTTAARHGKGALSKVGAAPRIPYIEQAPLKTCSILAVNSEPGRQVM